MMNESPPPRQPKPFAGLCDSCREARIIHSDRGAAFLRCSRADRDPAYARYPVLPVLRCPGYSRVPG
jgi:hypothetical protein